MSVSSWYELLASLLYINSSNSWDITTTIYDALIDVKPQYNEKQCGEALDVLKNSEFIKSGEDNDK